MEDFKVGDMIHKIINNIILLEKMYIILSIREKKGGDWHDGYSIEYIATINEIKEVFENNEIVEEEYLLRYTNYMCQCDVIFADLIII
jgi:hypothetical protein